MFLFETGLTETRASRRHAALACRVLSPMRLYHDFNILIKGHQKAQQALDGKLTELAAQHLGDIGLADPEQTRRLDLFQPAFFHEVSI